MLYAALLRVSAQGLRLRFKFKRTESSFQISKPAICEQLTGSTFFDESTIGDARIKKIESQDSRDGRYYFVVFFR